MYYIMSGSQMLHHPFSEHDIAISAKLSEELNTQGSLDMVLDDPQNIGVLSPIEVYDDDGLIWRGRILSISNGIDTRKTIHCEGALAYLCDTVVEPFSFRGRPDDNGNVKGLFHHFIDKHNAQLAQDDPRRFTVGQITVTDPNNYIYRSSESAMTTWEAIQSRLIETLGGYIYLSGPNLDVINYVDDFDEQSYQVIHFGENLIDLMHEDDANGIVTVLYAYGAQNDEEHKEPEPGGPNNPGYYSWYGNRVHLDAPVEHQTGTAKYGRIFGTAVFDDITLPENLATAAWKWLFNNYFEHLASLEISSADLSLTDPTIEKLGVGVYCSIICEPMDISVLMLVLRKETDLLNVSQTRIYVGKAPHEITSMVGG